MSAPSPAELWYEHANEDPERYRELMIEHGHIIPKTCGHEGQCECQNLPCGWPGHSRHNAQDGGASA